MTDSHEQLAQDSFPPSCDGSEQYVHPYISYDDPDLSDEKLYSTTADSLEETQGFTIRDSMLLEEGGLRESEPEQSLPAESDVQTRPDIVKAREAPRRIQERLYFLSEAKLAEQRERVQSEEMLEEDFHDHQKNLSKVEAETSEDEDAIPRYVLESMNKIKAASEENATSTFKACTILERAMPAFDYGRQAARDKFCLRRGSKRALDTFDTAFANMLKLRSEGSVEEAQTMLERKCYPFLEDAVQEAKDDRLSHGARWENENSSLTLNDIVSLQRETEADISGNKEDYQLIEEKCKEDLRTIDEHSAKLKSDMEQAKSRYTQEKLKREDQLVANRRRQEELRRELDELCATETKLDNTIKEGKKLQEKADRVYETAQQDILQWRKQIATLCKQAEVSLVIMDEVAESTRRIFRNAKEHKRRWTEELEHMKVESLLHLRDALIAKGCVHQMEADDSRNNIELTKQDIQKNEEKLKKMAQQNYVEEVRKKREKIERLKRIMDNYKERLAEHQSEVNAIKKELKTVDETIGEIQSSLRLDSFDERYRSFQQVRRRVFSNSDDDIQFCSHGKYSHY